MRSKMVAGSLAVVLALGAAACGDDDADTASPEAAGATTTTVANALSPAACDAYVALSAAVFEVPEGPGAGAFIESEALPQIQILADEAPEDLADAAQTMLEVGTASVDDPSQFEDPAAQAAFLEYGAGVHERCGYEGLDVSAIDYGFEGLPESVGGGTTSIALTNEGNEEHEIVLFRRADGETRPAEELLSLPDAELEQALQFSGATFASPGETGYVVTDLTPGGYVAVCFLPVGGAEDGPPHFTRGMLTELEVA